MGSALSGIATIAMGQLKATADARAANEDFDEEQKVLAFNALSARDKGRVDAGKVRMAGTQLAARQKVAYAASGVETTSGTAAAVQADTVGLAEVDAETVENNAAREVFGFQLQSEQSKRNRIRKLQAAERDAIGSALSGAGQIVGSGGIGGGGGG